MKLFAVVALLLFMFATCHSATISADRLKSLLKEPSKNVIKSLPRTVLQTNNRRIGSTRNYIIGGFDAPANTFKFVAQIMYWGTFTCGATMINLLTVVTAKHCVEFSTAQYFQVRVGEYNRAVNEGTEEDIDVKEMILHPTADIAILHLKAIPTKITAEDTIGLATTTPIGSMGITLGWGWMQHQGGGASAANILQLLMLPIQTTQSCINDDLTVEQYDICAGFSNGYYVNVCHGDSGGPLVVSDGSNGYKLLGVVSRGHDDCPEQKHHALYTSVPLLHSWITQNTHAVCFPGSSEVISLQGSMQMRDVEIGEVVQTINEDGEIEFAPVIGFMHRNENEPAIFINLETTNEGNISISPNHLIFKAAENSKSFIQATALYASDIVEGDKVFVTSFSGMNLGRVKSIKTVADTGVYAPLTEHATVVVDRVVASCYASFPSHKLAHWALAPYRLWIRWSNMDIFDVSRFFDIDYWLAGDSSIHWYPRLLMTIFAGPLNVFEK